MATGGNPDNPNVDLTKFWEDKDIEFMANMLRGTGKFHVVPLYGEEHHLTYEEEGEEEENIAASSLRAVQYSQRDVYISHAYERGISHVT